MEPAPRRTPVVIVLRACVRLALAVALIAGAATGAVLLLFTKPVFALLDFHPVALDYMAGRISRPELETMVILGQTFGRSQIDHLDDVAVLLDWLRWIFAMSVAAIAAATIFARSFMRPAASLAVVGLGMAVAVVVASYAALGFQTVGIAFHQIVFPQGNWSFPWNSLMIRLYGTGVMLRGAAFVITIGLAILAAAYFATRRIPRGPPRR